MRNWIEKLNIFSWLDENTIEEILLNTEEKLFSKWQILFIQWNESNGEWYIIKSWKVKVSIDQNQVAILWSWDIVWEIALLNEDKRTASVEAIEDTKVIIITIETLINLINNGNETVNRDVINRIEENLKNI